MTLHTREHIALSALDMETTEVSAAIAADRALATELTSLRETAHHLAVTDCMEPPPEVLARLMTTIGCGRFERFSSQVAQIFDVTIDRAREILGLIDRRASWIQALPNIGLIHFQGGPRCATADCGAVRVRAGTEFPLHKHRGDEMSVVVAGIVRISDGSVFHPGDEVHGAAGTSHSLTAEGNEDLILLARAFNGIELARSRQP